MEKGGNRPPPPPLAPSLATAVFCIYIGFRFKVGELNETKSSNGEEQDFSL